MKGEPRTIRISVGRRQAKIQTIARAALEMTDRCYIWLDRTENGIVVSLTDKNASEDDLESMFGAELERLQKHERLEKKTKLIRSAIVGRALGPLPKAKPAPSPGPGLDPETEAEIEKLLAEIESDDWLDEQGDIAKTWEERFGIDANPECKEKK